MIRSNASDGFVRANFPSGFLEPLRMAFVCYFGFLFLLLAELAHGGLSLVRRSIGQPVSDDALQRGGSAGNVVHAQPDVIGIPEVELREIAVQVGPADVLVHAVDAALED
jgi:hypothetical protein